MLHSLRNVTAFGFLGCVTMGVALHGCTSHLGPVRATQSAGGMGHPNLPDIVIQRSAECVAEYAQQMAPGRIVLTSTVEVNEDGDKLGVTIGGIPETAPDFGACLRNVLRYMPIAEQPLHEGVGTLKFHIEHASDSQEALNRFIEVIPGVPIVESELVLEAEGYRVVLPVTVKVVAKQVKQVDLDNTILTKIGQMALNSVGYKEIMRQAEERGWVKWVPVKQTQSAASKQFLADGPPLPNVQEIIKESFKLVMTKTAPVALTVSQLDTPAPGIGDLVAVGIIAVSLVAVGGISVYIYATHEDPPVPTPQPQPQPAPTPQVPPPPPPPPPQPRETCEANSELNKIIRCDDPGISHYIDGSENAAFKDIVRKRGKGLSKGKSKDKSTGGPCHKRGGWHTNVLRRGGSVASIVGCDCCDDSSGKAIQKEKSLIRNKP